MRGENIRHQLSTLIFITIPQGAEQGKDGRTDANGALRSFLMNYAHYEIWYPPRANQS